jgi:hypothetical protein
MHCSRDGVNSWASEKFLLCLLYKAFRWIKGVLKCHNEKAALHAKRAV